MRRFSKLLASSKAYAILGGAILCSLILLYSNDIRQMDAIRVWSINLVGSLQGKLAWCSRLCSLYEENKKLRAQNIQLALENSRLKEAMLESIRLRELLGFKARSELECVPAKIIGWGSSGFIHSIVLDRGKEQGLRRNMPLVTADGLVGKLYQVGRSRSLGQLLVDRNFRVSGKVQRSRITGIIGWTGEDICSFTGVPKRSDVMVGDVIVTSGYGSIFPEGLKVGVVSEVSEEEEGLFKRILVRPQVDFTKLEEVFVIRTQSSPN